MTGLALGSRIVRSPDSLTRFLDSGQWDRSSYRDPHRPRYPFRPQNVAGSEIQQRFLFSTLFPLSTGVNFLCPTSLRGTTLAARRSHPISVASPRLSWFSALTFFRPTALALVLTQSMVDEISPSRPGAERLRHGSTRRRRNVFRSPDTKPSDGPVRPGERSA